MCVAMPDRANPDPADIVTLAQSALSNSPHVALRNLTVQGDAGRLLILGRVSTFFQKQQAQETVRAAANRCLVVNKVEVK